MIKFYEWDGDKPKEIGTYDPATKKPSNQEVASLTERTKTGPQIMARYGPGGYVWAVESIDSKLTKLKHLSGKHDQRSHGYRFGAAPSLSRARQLRKDGLWGDFKKRAEGRSGVDKSPREAKRLKRAQEASGRIKEHQNKLVKSQKRLDKLQDAEQEAWAKKRGAEMRVKRLESETDTLSVQATRADRKAESYWDSYNFVVSEGEAHGSDDPSHENHENWKRTHDLYLKQANEVQAETDALWDKWESKRNERDAAMEVRDKAEDVYQKAKSDRVDAFYTHDTLKSNYAAMTANDRRTVMTYQKQRAREARDKLVKDAYGRQSKLEEYKNAHRAERKKVQAIRESHPLKAEYDEQYNLFNSRLRSDNEEERIQAGIDWLDYQQKFKAHPYSKKEMATAEAQERAAWNKYKTLKDDNRGGAHLRQGKPTLKPKITTGTGETAEDVEMWTDGSNEFSKLVGRQPLLDAANPTIGNLRSDPTRSVGEMSEGRSYAREAHVYMGDNAKRVVIHELGHALEHSDPGIAAETQKFLKRRTQGESVQRLSDVTGQRYGPDEITKVDKFIRPYMGKIYDQGSTEILSMGLELFYDNPMMLARRDPDMFDFIFSVVRFGNV